MKTEHPITPPPELVKEWATANGTIYKNLSDFCQNIANQAARWGADQELEACCEWVTEATPWAAHKLRAARRPKSPSLKKQALALLDKNKTRFAVAEEDVIRRALEALPDV